MVTQIKTHLLLEELLGQQVSQSETGHGGERLGEDGLRFQQAVVRHPENTQPGRLLLVSVALGRGRRAERRHLAVSAPADTPTARAPFRVREGGECEDERRRQESNKRGVRG